MEFSKKFNVHFSISKLEKKMFLVTNDVIGSAKLRN